MDWIQFLQIICVPVFRCFFYKLGEQRKEIKLFERDLNEFKVSVAKEYTTQININRQSGSHFIHTRLSAWQGKRTSQSYERSGLSIIKSLIVSLLLYFHCNKKLQNVNSFYKKSKKLLTITYFL